MSELTAQSDTGARIKLYPYQMAWIKDEARFKLMVKGRQIGLTFATTLRQVRRRIGKKGTTIWLSAGQRQSREAIDVIKTHTAALRHVFDYEEIDFPDFNETALLITMKHNGSRIVAMPANPDTVRGFSGDVVLDEFQGHKQPKKIWKAAVAMATRGYQVEIVGTPNMQHGRYWEIAKKHGVPAEGHCDRTQWTDGPWSIHWIDIFTAVAQGCPINIGEMRAGVDDEDTWQQEYCCVFLSDAENYISTELIVAVENDQATIELPKEFSPSGLCYLGVDVGRKKDRSVLYLIERVGDVFWTRAVRVLEKTPFKAQREAIEAMMPYVHRCAIDATGIGAQLAEELVTKFGSGRVEAVEFNIANKESMATLAKRQFEDRTIRIPGADFLRRSINAVKRYTSPTGHFRFDADRTDQGHADEFWAMALSIAAGTGTPKAAMVAIDGDDSWYQSQSRGAMTNAARYLVDRENPDEEQTEAFTRDRRSLWAS